MNRQEILMNYAQAKYQAQRLDDIADRIERLANSNMDSSLKTLQVAWKSDNSPQFYTKAETVRSAILTDAANIRKVAASIRATAEAVKNADLRALEIAQARTYNV